MRGAIGTFLALTARSRARSFRQSIRYTSTTMARSINLLSTCVLFRRLRSLRKSSCKDFNLRDRNQYDFSAIRAPTSSGGTPRRLNLERHGGKTSVVRSLAYCSSTEAAKAYGGARDP